MPGALPRSRHPAPAPGAGRAVIVSDLRDNNERRSARLLARSELLDTSGLEWGGVGEHPVAPAVIECLVYMRDVEAFTNRYLTGLVAHPATLADPLVSAFLPIWQAEEGAHADALSRYLYRYAARTGTTIPAAQAPPPVPASERWLVAATRPVGHVVTAAHMLWGAANELLTMTGYRLLAARCGEPTLAELLRRIAAQESRHYAFYRLQAEWRLAASRLGRAVLPRIMRRAWTPVGVGDGFKARGEFDRVLAFLSTDERGRAAAETMDGAFRRLPGCGELRIFHTAMCESRRRLGLDAAVGPSGTAHAQ